MSCPKDLFWLSLQLIMRTLTRYTQAAQSPLSRLMTVSILAALPAVAGPAAAQGGPPPEVRTAIQAIVQMLEGDDDASLRTFAAGRLAPVYRDRYTEEALFAHLKDLRREVGGPVGGVSAERDPDGIRLILSGKQEVTIKLDLTPDGLVTRLELGSAGAAVRPSPDAPASAVTWQSLPAELRRLSETGLSGVVLAHRDGREVLRETYGLADRETGRRTALTTVYDIGSTPIDFTVTGIMLLGQRGQLTLDDSIGRFFSDVPVDKRAITIRHLLTGRSGLRDFHDVPGTDWDPDLAWVDRETAIRRILSGPLLFAPGQGEEHSHSAFGVLAAVMEIVSGRSYQDYVRAEMFEPLGMTRTGFYGERMGLSADDFAVGYGSSSVGVPNIPPNWGPTSWLVMGSGGMFSALDDMARYYAAIESGRLVTGEWAALQQGERVGVGGTDRGFFIFRATNGRGSQVLLIVNAESRAPATRALTRSISRMVMGR